MKDPAVLFGLEAEHVMAEYLRRRGLSVDESGAAYSGKGRDPGDLRVNGGGRTLRIEVKRSDREDFPIYSPGCRWPFHYAGNDMLFIDDVGRFDRKVPVPDYYALFPLHMRHFAVVDVSETRPRWQVTNVFSYKRRAAGMPPKQRFYWMPPSELAWRVVDDLP